MRASVDDGQVRELQAVVQAFVRGFGLLVTKRTPCGHPVAPSHAHALMILLEREASGMVTTQSELAALLGLDKSSIARLCARLETEQHAKQERAPGDGRSRLLELTGRGRRMAASIQSASLARFRRVAEAVPAGKRLALVESVRLLTVALDCLKEDEA